MSKQWQVGFNRRLYCSWMAFWDDLRYVFSRRDLIHRVMREGLITPPFRERLMMVVTQVNGCRYCSYFHAREAAKSGIPPGELRDLLAGEIPGDTPDAELPALIYAQHWAENDAQPDPEAARKFQEFYGEEKAKSIHLVLRMIRIGNLLGNLWDFLLHKVSF